MDSLKIPSDIILAISIVTLIVLIGLVIFYKVRKDRRQRAKNRREIELKKDSMMATDIKESELLEQSVKDQPQPRRYLIYKNSDLKNKLVSSELKSSPQNDKIPTRYTKYLGEGFIKRDKDVNQGDIHWR